MPRVLLLKEGIFQKQESANMSISIYEISLNQGKYLPMMLDPSHIQIRRSNVASESMMRCENLKQ